MKNKVLISVLLITFMVVLLSACNPPAVQERLEKDKQSEAEGGLWRNAIHYGENGEIINQIWGKFDLEITADGHKVKFDNGNERHIWIILSGSFESNEVGEDAVRKYWSENEIKPPDYTYYASMRDE